MSIFRPTFASPCLLQKKFRQTFSKLRCLLAFSSMKCIITHRSPDFQRILITICLSLCNIHRWNLPLATIHFETNLAAIVLSSRIPNPEPIVLIDRFPGTSLEAFLHSLLTTTSIYFSQQVRTDFYSH